MHSLARPLALFAALSAFSCSADPAAGTPAGDDAATDTASPPPDTTTSGEDAQPDAVDSIIVDDTDVADTAGASVADTGDASDTSVVDAADTGLVDAADTSVADTSDASVADTSDTSVDAGVPRAHIVGTDPFTYAEMAETTNGNTAGSEATGYTLDSTGAVFSGVFESTSPTGDCYRFNTGSATKVAVQVFLDGFGLNKSPGTVFITLDNVVTDGLSSLSALDYFANATVTAGEVFRVCVLQGSGPSIAGKSYSVEIRQNP